MPVSIPTRVPRGLGRTPGRGVLLAVLLFTIGIAIARRHAPGPLFATSPAPAGNPRRAIAVRSDADGMEFLNTTNLEWRGCTVTILGEYTSALPSIGPASAIRVPYRAFVLGADRLNPAEGFPRAFHSTDIACVASDGHVEHAILD